MNKSKMLFTGCPFNCDRTTIVVYYWFIHYLTILLKMVVNVEFGEVRLGEITECHVSS